MALLASAALSTSIACSDSDPIRSDGRHDPPGSGLLFALTSIGVAERTRGYDLDGACVATDDCVDNRLYQLRIVNPELERVLAESTTKVIVELAGLEPERTEEPDLLTVKFYVAEPGPGGAFRIAPASLLAGAARSAALATLDAGEIRAPPGNELEIVLGAETGGSNFALAFRLSVAGLEARLDAERTRLDRGLIGGAATIPDLASRPNPFCGTEDDFCARMDQTLLDLVADAVQPDIDLEPKNGLERIHVSDESNRVSRCLDGAGRELEPSNTAEPWTCALRPELQDGYSISFEFEATRFDGALQ